MTQRDWQKDMTLIIHEEERWEVLGSVPNELHIASYWLHEAKTLQEIASGRGREALRLSKLLGDLNNELTASEERADAAEAALAEEKKVSAYHERDAHEGYQREQRLKVAIECAIEEYGLWNDKSRAAEVIITELKRELSTLYPDTPAPAAPTPGITARPIDEWHEDYGDALWWTFPIQEPPYCGSPLDVDWPEYHTHWTPLVLPAAPKEGSHETSEIKRCD